jgi:hypothetical protein
MRVRKKPVEVEAWQWKFDQSGDVPPPWVPDALFKWPDVGGMKFEPDHAEGPRISIASTEGVMVATPGYWIIKGVEGEIYPCSAEVFEQTYEVVT